MREVVCVKRTTIKSQLVKEFLTPPLRWSKLRCNFLQTFYPLFVAELLNNIQFAVIASNILCFVIHNFGLTRVSAYFYYLQRWFRALSVIFRCRYDFYRDEEKDFNDNREKGISKINKTVIEDGTLLWAVVIIICNWKKGSQTMDYRFLCINVSILQKSRRVKALLKKYVCNLLFYRLVYRFISGVARTLGL